MRKYWSVAMTHKGQERRAAHHIERQAFRYYLPEFQGISAKGAVMRKLLFPGYIFYEVRAGWAVLANTRGISSLFICNDRPARMPQHEVEGLMGREEEGFVKLHSFNEGDQAKVNVGAFRGLTGIVQGMTDAGRRQVLFTILGRAVRGEFDERVLEAA